ncbi:hypothetical protein NQ318_010383 [Aromia moschata]|uniref:Spt20-like SEP domain-containing protein n=1 Tax=Aromia moschata TaxID=1265417 RepID=A0AAV8XV17_9CUCU|nr:hypothetical protein NQ318_010383 [Aromia moschata]
MQSLEAACEEGERSTKRFKPSRSSLPLLRPQEPSTSASTSTDVSGTPPPKPTLDIFAKLLELQEEEDSDDELSDSPGCKYKSRLLEKLVARERLNTLILNLYPGNKGYSLAFRTMSRTDPNYTEDTANMIETKKWPYEEDDLLRYIDNEELPPFIIDLLEPQFSYLFYSGCIIAEVREYRQAYPFLKCDIHHVLLRPTLKSILADINNIAEERPDWGNEERDQLESQLLMANEPTLCLDPDNSICERVTELNNRRHMWNTRKFRRMARKFSPGHHQSQTETGPVHLQAGTGIVRLHQLDERETKDGNPDECDLEVGQEAARRAEARACPQPGSPADYPTPEPVVINEFKTYKRPKETSDCLPQLIEEYILETDMPSRERGKPRIYHIKLSILQRPSNSEYLGELYLDRDHKKNEQNGVACRFSLGSRANANRYVHQFTEIFTESGRKSVRIRYGLSPGFLEQVQAHKLHAHAAAQMSLLAQHHLNQLSHALQGQSYIGPMINGNSLLHQAIQSMSTVPILGSSQVKSSQQAISNQELAINALATKLMNSAQQFQAAANAKQQQQQQQQQKLASSNPAIINLLNSSPASNANSDASAAVMNAINSSSLLPQQIQTINQKVLARKMTIPNARILNHSNLIALNNNRVNLQELNTQLATGQQQQQQPQTITLASVNSGNYTNITAVPVRQQVVSQRVLANNSSDSNKSALSALLVGTPRRRQARHRRPQHELFALGETGGVPGNSQSGSTHFIQSPKGGQQLMVQSPKANTVLSPMSSPPPQSTNTINLQSIPGLQNLQVQLSGFAQPISLSLNVSSTGSIQGHPTSLIVSLPVTTATQTSNTITQAAGSSSDVYLCPQTVSIAQGSQPFQLITPLQRPRGQQATTSQQNLASRTLQRTPITIKMATPNTNASQVTSNPTISSQLQKQAQLQQYQQICLNQPSILGRIRRRSNTSDPQ